MQSRESFPSIVQSIRLNVAFELPRSSPTGIPLPGVTMVSNSRPSIDTLPSYDVGQQVDRASVSRSLLADGSTTSTSAPKSCDCGIGGLVRSRDAVSIQATRAPSEDRAT